MFVWLSEKRAASGLTTQAHRRRREKAPDEEKSQELHNASPENQKAVFGAASLLGVAVICSWADLYFDRSKHEWLSDSGRETSGVSAFQIPWLNLLCSDFGCARQAELGLSIPILNYVVRKDIHDRKSDSLFAPLEELLKEIFPDSPLFLLAPRQLQYRKGHPSPISCEWLEMALTRIREVVRLQGLEGEVRFANQSMKF